MIDCFDDEDSTMYTSIINQCVFI